MNIIAIVGSTTLTDQRARDQVKEILAIEKPDMVISGGARGIDTLAREEATHLGIYCYEMHPQCQTWVDEKRVGFRERNRLIARACDILYRISDPNTTTYGSGWTADLAAELRKVVVRIELEPMEASQ